MVGRSGLIILSDAGRDLETSEFPPGKSIIISPSLFLPGGGGRGGGREDTLSEGGRGGGLGDGCGLGHVVPDTRGGSKGRAGDLELSGAPSGLANEACTAGVAEFCISTLS